MQLISQWVLQEIPESCIRSRAAHADGGCFDSPAAVDEPGWSQWPDCVRSSRPCFL